MGEHSRAPNSPNWGPAATEMRTKADPRRYVRAVELLAWLPNLEVPIVAGHQAHAVTSEFPGMDSDESRHHRAESKPEGPGAHWQPRRASRCESALCRATNYVTCAMRLLLPQGRTGVRLWGLFFATLLARSLGPSAPWAPAPPAEPLRCQRRDAERKRPACPGTVTRNAR